VPDRPLSFSVTAAGGNVKLDDSGEAKASFTVTNASSRAVTGELLTKPREPAKPEWFSVVGESIRDFTPNAAEGVVVKLDVPPGSPPGPYSFRLDAVNENDPDEDYTEGPFVSFDVATPTARKKKFPWWILILVGAAVLLIIGVVVWLLVRDSGPKSATVPAVLSMAARAAESTLTNAGFTVKTRSVPVTDPTTNGDVQSQDPAAGTAQPPGTAVTIAVGHMSRVPSVKGLDETKAKATLADADLKIAARHVGDPPVQDLIVLDQDPPAGSLQRPGTVVTITAGPTVAVPDVKGKSLLDAELYLWYAEHLNGDLPQPAEPGLRSSVTLVVRDDQNGIVLSQNPAPGTRLPHGSVVELRVGFAD
jgi:beta-lactam-binding protein with PASTA domain